MTHLFRFSLSPVQSFIAQARKTQDLYAGSRILSELAKTAAVEAGKQGIVLIFPTTTEGRSFPNRFIGKIDGNMDDAALRKKGEAIEAAVQELFKKFAAEAREKVKQAPPDGFDTQIAEYLDINWLFYEVTTTYEATYQESESLLAALKNERYHTNKNPEAGRKCSLDGERNALFFGQGTNPTYLEQNNAATVTTCVWLAKNEGLSAVSLLKRGYGKSEDRKFPSTAKVALAQEIANLNTEQKKLYDCYEKLFSKDFPKACFELVKQKYLDNFNITVNENGLSWRTEFDEQLLCEENLTDREVPNSDQLRIAKIIQRELAPQLTQKYYALLTFDGDKMGKLLSGETRTDKSGDLATFQSNVAAQLQAFSHWIYTNSDNTSDKYESGKMHVIYAGGDDFMGLVSLNDLFSVVKTLRNEFDKQVNQPLRSEVTDDITFSMGITIAHYKEPLSMVLQTTREMEKLAKNKGGRNAFAVAALKHSGDNHQACFTWGDGLEKWNALKELVGHFQNDCSETLARSLERQFYALKDEKGKMKEITRTLTFVNPVTKQKEKPDEAINMLGAELLRLSRRSLPEEKKDNAGCLKNTVMKFFESEAQKFNPKIDIQNGLEAVNIALFLKRKNKQDGTPN